MGLHPNHDATKRTTTTQLPMSFLHSYKDGSTTHQIWRLHETELLFDVGLVMCLQSRSDDTRCCGKGIKKVNTSGITHVRDSSQPCIVPPEILGWRDLKGVYLWKYILIYRPASMSDFKVPERKRISMETKILNFGEHPSIISFAYIDFQMEQFTRSHHHGNRQR